MKVFLIKMNQGRTEENSENIATQKPSVSSLNHGNPDSDN